MNLELAVCLPRTPESIRVARRVTSGALVTLGVTSRCVDDIRLAVSEACTIVVELSRDGEYEVRMRADEQQCDITVARVGAGLEATAPAAAGMPDHRSQRALGIAIMRALMDGVEFSVAPSSGTTYRLRKALSLEPDGPLAWLGPPQPGDLPGRRTG
jgi:serine/threonine-protein kinase RsbW